MKSVRFSGLKIGDKFFNSWDKDGAVVYDTVITPTSSGGLPGMCTKCGATKQRNAITEKGVGVHIHLNQMVWIK